MSRSITITRAARHDIRQAREWYQTARSGLGDEFLDELHAALGLAAEAPERHAPAAAGTRRLLLSRFPYAVYFRVEARRLVVVAVLHGRQDRSRHLDDR